MFEKFTVTTLWYRVNKYIIINLSEVDSVYVNESNSVWVIYKNGTSQLLSKFNTEKEAINLVDSIWGTIKNES